MSARVAVVIPSRNEEDWIEVSVRSAIDAEAAEIVVVDGGSTDRTVSRARSLGATVVTAEGTRARRLNAGFAATNCDAVCFLHADTTLPKDACRAIAGSVSQGTESGGFLLRFTERDPRLTFAALLINLRTRITHAPWGDQAQFFRSDVFAAADGYADVPIMEDYEMARRMKTRARPAILPLRVTTSGRRFLEFGLLATTITNWRIVLAWHMGVPPEDLRRLYGSR